MKRTLTRTLTQKVHGQSDGFGPLFRRLRGQRRLSFSSQRGDAAGYRGGVRLASSLEDRDADIGMLEEAT